MNLGPKGLFFKVGLPLTLVMLVTTVALSVYVPGTLREIVLEESISYAKATISQLKILPGYYTKAVVKKVLANSDLKPAIDHQNNPNAIPPPATLIHDLSKAVSETGTETSLYSPFPFPNRQSRQLDAFQTEAWEFLTRNPDETFVREEVVEGESFARVAIADKMVSEVCTGCHNSRADTPKNDWRLGDVRGVLEARSNISKPLASGQAAGLTIVGAQVAVLLGGLYWTD